jgi:multiple RNA-binding domain-containing protein 1
MFTATIIFNEHRIFNLLIVKVGANDSSHRGFGFVEYLTKTDARRAFDELVHSTHLYGRRLVLEWAKSDESLGELRDKTLDHFASEADRRHAGKLKRKMEKITSDLTVIDDD